MKAEQRAILIRETNISVGHIHNIYTIREFIRSIALRVNSEMQEIYNMYNIYYMVELRNKNGSCRLAPCHAYGSTRKQEREVKRDGPLIFSVLHIYFAKQNETNASRKWYNNKTATTTNKKKQQENKRNTCSFDIF